MSDLSKLAKPFPEKYVKEAPKGKWGSYVPHHTVAQALLATLGPYDLHIREVLRGTTGKIEGCVLELSATIDGKLVTVQEAGDCENPDVWKTDGARLKDAVSDGLKRCAMRIGLGLSLWCQDDYFLHESLIRRDDGDPRQSELPESHQAPQEAAGAVVTPHLGLDVARSGIRAVIGTSWIPTDIEASESTNAPAERDSLLKQAAEVAEAAGWGEDRLRAVLGHKGKKSLVKAFAEMRLSDLRTAVELMRSTAQKDAFGMVEA